MGGVWRAGVFKDISVLGIFSLDHLRMIFSLDHLRMQLWPLVTGQQAPAWGMCAAPPIV